MQNIFGDPNSISIGRQPIFKENGRLWGFELFCVGNSRGASVAVDIQSSAYISLQQILESNRARGRAVIEKNRHRST